MFSSFFVNCRKASKSIPYMYNNSNNGGNRGYMNPNQPGQRGGYPLDRYSPSSQTRDDNSPFYKPQAPSVSLPKGGGALKAIDEKFTVNPVNGTVSMEIPLPLTPGRNGFTPKLSIGYNSGGGNSEFGQGWSLSLSGIQRRTDKWIPQFRDYEESDVFTLDGGDDLVPEQEEVNGKWVVKRRKITSGGVDYIVTNYRPRIEGLYARIELVRRKDAAGSWWRVTTKDNITTWYGLTSQSRIANPEYPDEIFKWLPEFICDDKGNVQQFIYVPEDAHNRPFGAFERNRVQDGQLTAVNIYLKRVLYGNVTPYSPVVENESTAYEPAIPSGTFLMEMVLDYGDHDAEYPQPEPDTTWPGRNDPFSNYRAGFEIRTYRKCRRVLMFHRFAELNAGNPTLVRSLDLEWKHDGLDPDTLVETDYITAATQAGYTLKPGNTYYRKALPAMTFDYEPLGWNTSLESVSEKDAAGAPQGLTGPYQWIDFYGEGISGILTEQGNGWYYKRNLGDGHFTPASVLADKPSFTGLGGGLQWQDLDADGGRQVVSMMQPVMGYWELADDDNWEGFRAFGTMPNIDWDSPYTLRLDLDGDGRPDTLVAGDQVWTWYHNKGREGYDTGGQISVPFDEEKGPVLIFRDVVQSVYLADMSGDGLTDLVRVRNGSICYWPNMGYGKFGAKVEMDDAPRFDYVDQYNPIYITLADISGTGAADLVYVGTGECIAWINLAGNGWSEAKAISYLPSTDPYSKIAVLDFLGNGTGCIVWSSPLPNHAQTPIRYIDLMGGKKPYLLRQYSNGLRKTTELTYKSSTQFYLQDEREGLHWATKLPFPVHCLERVKTMDAVSQTEYTQSYRYHHGYYDSPEREFRGFGRVDTLDIETADTGPGELDQAPVLTRTWYHTGAWIKEKKLEERYAEEYFHIDDWEIQLKPATLPTGVKWQELREAYRALKGLPLRQEVYAQDADPDAGKPYTVTAYTYCVNLVQELHTNRHASFYPYQEQSLAFHCERKEDDPRVLHELTLEIDEYGNILQNAQVVYPRKSIPGTLPAAVRTAQGRMHIISTHTDYTNDVIDTTDHIYYRLRLPWETKRHEVNVALTPPAVLWTVATLRPLIEGATEVDFTQTPSNGQKRLIGHNRIRYRTDSAVDKLAFGVLESLGIEYERYQLAFTQDTLDISYSDYDPNGDLIPDTNRVTSAMLSEGGYKDLDTDGKWWVRSGRAWYGINAAQQFYTPEKYIDPWKKKTSVTYWGSYWLLPQLVEDAKGNKREITAYDWRNLQPAELKDANDDISGILYDALGLPVAMALQGKGTEGDTLDNIDPEDGDDIDDQAAFWTDPQVYAADLLVGATWRCVYDFSGGQPVAVGMIAREQHNAVEPDSPMLIRLSYTDGLGRMVMHKVQCEPDIIEVDHVEITRSWIGSGRTIYNNKGKEVMQYEPYFSTTHACDTAEQATQEGVSVKLHYDPLGRVQRTDYPDGSYEETKWTAWEQELYDRNDNVLASDWYAAWSTGTTEEQDAATKAAAHNNTPTVQHLDTLARPFYTIQYLADKDNTPPPGLDPIHSYVTLDILGNRIKVTDGRGKDTLQYRYNMLQSPCRQDSMDSGTGRTLTDVSGQPLYGWDAGGRRFRYEYDVIRRPVKKSCGCIMLWQRSGGWNNGWRKCCTGKGRRTTKTITCAVSSTRQRMAQA